MYAYVCASNCIVLVCSGLVAAQRSSGWSVQTHASATSAVQYNNVKVYADALIELL